MVSQRFPEIAVEGNAYEMGRQHGEQADGLIARYLVLIDRLTGQPRDISCRNALRFLPYIERLSPSFVAEVHGLAEGARISFEEALLCQVRAEAAGHWPGEGCTAFALRGECTLGGDLLVGQNQDMPSEYLDVSILLRLKPSDGRPRALIYTFAGQLGYFGMNQYGVANYANALYDYAWRPGIAQYPLKRAVLEQTTVHECIQLFQVHPACSAANTIVSDGQGGMADIECRPEGIGLFAGQHRDMIVHTNHYLTPQFAHYETHSLPDSVARLARISQLVRENWGCVTVELLRRMLADHAGDPAGICRHGERNMHTSSGHIAQPQKGVLHIRYGHGCTGSWETYSV